MVTAVERLSSLHCPRTPTAQTTRQSKLRLDAFLSAQLPDASRAKIQASIKAGLTAVNGVPAGKPSVGVKVGDVVSCSMLPPEPCSVSCWRRTLGCWRCFCWLFHDSLEPPPCFNDLNNALQPKPNRPSPSLSHSTSSTRTTRSSWSTRWVGQTRPSLRPWGLTSYQGLLIDPTSPLTYHTQHHLTQQAPGMVVHLSPGHTRGTLVNALLGHCGLPAMSVPSGSARAGGGGLAGGGAGEEEDGGGEPRWMRVVGWVLKQEQEGEARKVSTPKPIPSTTPNPITHNRAAVGRGRIRGAAAPAANRQQ
jgi:hypothetical protein